MRHSSAKSSPLPKIKNNSKFASKRVSIDDETTSQFEHEEFKIND
jgi:hypothetical protein